MDRAASRGPRPGPPGSLLHGSCNYLQNVVAISYIFVLQLPTFLLCSIHWNGASAVGGSLRLLSWDMTG